MLSRSPTMAKKKNRTPTAWEIAKPFLEKDYLEKRITDDMAPSYVYTLRTEFQNCKYTNFRNNFRRMKNTIMDLKDRADEELDLLQFDLGLFTLASEKEDCWDGSEAKRLLPDDLLCHPDMKPKQLWMSRDEYQKFTLKQFRDHIHQLSRAKLETNYWLVKRKKKEMKKAGIVEEEEDFQEFFADFVVANV